VYDFAVPCRNCNRELRVHDPFEALSESDVWVWALVRLQEGWKLPLHLDVNNYTALHKGLLLRLRSVADNLPHRQTLSADR
jgi:hypothetical protein